jgi:hypothetical protein
MKLSLLLAAALAVACPPPFNDVRFMANDTVDSATLVRNYLDAQNNLNPNLDWYEKVSSGANPAVRWPARQVHGESLTIINWCLADENAYNLGLDAYVNAGGVFGNAPLGSPTQSTVITLFSSPSRTPMTALFTAILVHMKTRCGIPLFPKIPL